MLDIFYGYLLMTCVSLFSQVFFILWPSLLIFFIVNTLWCILFQLHFFFKYKFTRIFLKSNYCMIAYYIYIIFTFAKMATMYLILIINFVQKYCSIGK